MDCTGMACVPGVKQGCMWGQRARDCQITPSECHSNNEPLEMQGIAIHQKRPKKSTRKHEPLDILNGGVDKCCSGLGYNAWQAPLDSGCFLKF